MEKAVVVIDTENLKQNLEKLSKCKGLSKEDLQGRYKNSYNRLKEDIKKSATAILKDISLGNLRWNDLGYATAMEVADEVNAFLKEPEGKVIMKRISYLLFKHCSYDEFHSECLKMREQVKHIFWKYTPQDWESIEVEVAKHEQAV